MIFGSFDARVFQIDKVSQQWGQSRFAHRNLLSLGFVPSSGFSLPMSTQSSQPTQDDAISVPPRREGPLLAAEARPRWLPAGSGQASLRSASARAALARVLPRRSCTLILACLPDATTASATVQPDWT